MEKCMGMTSKLVLAFGLCLVAGGSQAFTRDLRANPHGTYTDTVVKGASTDKIEFSLSSTKDLGLELFSSDKGGIAPVGFFDLYDSTTKTLVYSGQYSGSVPAVFTYLDLSKGNYYFSINNFTTKAVTDPSLSWKLNVSAVPEPQTYAMMLAGLVVVGMTFRRRRYVD